MKTYKLSQQDLHHLLEHAELITTYDRLIKNYIADIICPKYSLDLTKGNVTYNLAKGEVYYEERKQPQPENKPGQSGDTKPPASGNVQRENKSNG